MICQTQKTLTHAYGRHRVANPTGTLIFFYGSFNSRNNFKIPERFCFAEFRSLFLRINTEM